MKNIYKMSGAAASAGAAVLIGKILYHKGYEKGCRKALRDGDEMGVF